MTAAAAKTPPEIRALRDRCVVDPDDFEAWLAGMDWSWQGLGRGEYGVSLEQAQLRFVCEDPVLWCRAFLTEPDTGEPYDFWPYQRVSVRAWEQDCIHQDGAEVGKTREIVGLILWGQCTGFGFTLQNPSMLIAAPQQTHLDEIIMAVEAHVGEGEGSEGSPPLINRFWRKPKKHPHYLMRWKGPTCTANQLGLVYYRPAGFDGEAFRGVHVSAMALYDEAAKTKNRVCWSEFHRALKPGCRQRIYSVPDGDNTTEYFRMTQEALPGLPAGTEGMRLFHWPKTLMPPPFWSEEREREMVRRYGGRDTPGFQRNVLGVHGQQENPVWPWETLEPNLRDVPEYVSLHLVADRARGEMHVSAYRIRLAVVQGKKSAREVTLADRYDDLDALLDSRTRRDAVAALLREFVEPRTGGVYWAGADLGFSKDPTEIFVSQEIGGELRDLVRVHARGVDYDLQCEIIHALDGLFDRRAGWAADYGSAGTAVVSMLHNLELFEDGHYDERLVGFQFSSVVDCLDEEGNLLEEADARGDAKAVRLPAKELATNLITARLQRRGYAWPYDSAVVGHFTNHTAKEGARHRIFAKSDDHTIDAKRVQILRKVFDEEVGGGAAVFSSGAHERAA